ncbi:MAG: hypothetical protein Q7S97_01095 [Polaromonas sp.]|nr:hypothetical protein [Polaromonas sp.]
MKRRKVLTSASVLAGAALTGCGGGGEDGALGGDPSSQIGAYTIPRYLVPNNGQYQIEVVFATTRKVSVAFINSATFPDNRGYWSKDVTTSSSHQVGFALWRCNLGVDVKYTDWRLQVVEGSNGSTTHAGTSNTTPDNFRQYQTFTDGDTEYEWNFYSRIDQALLLSVRFFPIPSDETINFNTGEYVRVISNTATHTNQGTLTRYLPKHHATPHQITDHEAACIEDASTNKDTICLPNNRRAGHNELVPSYLAASAAEKPLLRRRLLRHVDRFTKATRSSHVMDSPDDQEVHNLLGNELVRVLGGKSLIDHLNNVRDNVRTSIQNNMDQMGAAFHTFCSNNLPALSSQAMIDQTRKLLDDEVDNGEGASDMAGGCGVSTSLQFGFSMTETTLWPGISVGGGVRVSIGLARASRKWYDRTVAAVETYNLTQHATKGTKLGFTFILKGFDGSNLSIKGVSADIEVTLNMTIIDGVHRLDLIQFDPVLDLDTRTWLGKMVAKGLARLLAPVVGGTQTTPVLQGMSYGVSPFATDLGPAIGVFAGKLASSVGGFVNAGVKGYLNPLLQYVRDTLDDAGADTRTWGTAEFSPLRIIIPNSDANNPDIDFRGGFRYGSVGWQPGVKYIAGFGIAPSYNVPYVAPGQPKPPGTVTYSGFARVVAVADLYVAYGPDNFVRSMGFPWEM